MNPVDTRSVAFVDCEGDPWYRCADGKTYSLYPGRPSSVHTKKQIQYSLDIRDDYEQEKKPISGETDSYDELPHRMYRGEETVQRVTGTMFYVDPLSSRATYYELSDQGWSDKLPLKAGDVAFGEDVRLLGPGSIVERADSIGEVFVHDSISWCHAGSSYTEGPDGPTEYLVIRNGRGVA